ncbi:MAG: sulfatase-like hydrolase/transferase [Myxococcales bacterium]|nr:sulfatase-like hydrolase/transferase [Myxococcales bacterium]
MVAALVGALLGCTGTDPTQPAEVDGVRFDGPAPTNLLLLSLDTMRRDHFGRYGEGDHTPFIDSLAASGVALDDFSVCSNWTTATFACVMSGATNLDRAATRTMVPILLPNGPLQSVPEEPQLATWLAEASFDSALITSNWFFSRAHGVAQGFGQARFDGPRGADRLWDLAQTVIDPEQGGTPLTEPFYLHLHFFEPHRPYTPPEEFLTPLARDLPPPAMSLADQQAQERAIEAMVADPPVLSDAEIDNLRAHMRARYAAEVRSFDAALERTWRELDRLGLLDDTLVVFFTDHGEALWEHGYSEHGKLLRRNENDAAAWLWARNIVPGSFTGPTAAEDLAPTILDALGVDIPAQVTGHVVGTAPKDRARFAFSDGFQGGVQSVRQGRFLMHFQWNEPPPGQTNLILYDLQADPLEQTNLFDPEAPSEDALRLWSVLEPKVQQAIPWVVGVDPRKREVHWPL